MQHEAVNRASPMCHWPCQTARYPRLVIAQTGWEGSVWEWRIARVRVRPCLPTTLIEIRLYPLLALHEQQSLNFRREVIDWRSREQWPVVGARFDTCEYLVWFTTWEYECCIGGGTGGSLGRVTEPRCAGSCWRFCTARRGDSLNT